MEIWVQSWRPRTIAFCDFSSPSKRSRLPRKSDVRSYEVLHLSRKIISANLKIWGSKMQPLSGNQRPDLLRALMKMSLVLRLPRKMHLCRSCSNVPRLPSLLEMPQNPLVLLTFDKVHNPLRLPRESTSGVFSDFDFEMCFAPQRRAIVHLSFGQIAPHPRLKRAYFSTLRSHKSLEKHRVSRLSYLFAHLHLLYSDSFSSLIFSLLLFSSLWLFPSLLFICPYCRKFDF